MTKFLEQIQQISSSNNQYIKHMKYTVGEQDCERTDPVRNSLLPHANGHMRISNGARVPVGYPSP